MATDDAARTLHHDLRSALSAVQMNLQTLQALEAREHDLTPEKRTAILERARHSLTRAVEIADRLRAVDRTLSNLDSSASGRKS